MRNSLVRKCSDALNDQVRQSLVFSEVEKTMAKC